MNADSAEEARINRQSSPIFKKSKPDKDPNYTPGGL